MWMSIRLLNGGKEETEEAPDTSEAPGREFLDSESEHDVDELQPSKLQFSGGR